MEWKCSKKIIIVSIISVIVSFLILFFVFSNSDKRKLLLRCTIEKENEYFTFSREVVLYKLGKNDWYSDKIELVELTSDEKINKTLENFIIINGSNNPDKFLSYSIEGNKLYISGNINLSKESKEKIIKYVGTSNTSVSNFKKHFEEGGLTCQEF